MQRKETTVRPAALDDRPELMALAGETGMFSRDELDAFAGLLSEGLEGALGGDHRWIVDDDDGVRAAAYYAPEPMANGVWNLYFLGVRAVDRRQGRAGALLRHVEAVLRRRGARLLIIETSSLNAFEPARRLYRKHGYGEEARIRDFYRDGDDKVVFRKALGGPTSRSTF